MEMSRIEVNMRRLMAKCELIIKDKLSKKTDQLDKYIESIEEMMINLEKTNPKPTNETMVEYSIRLDKLKKAFLPNEYKQISSKRNKFNDDLKTISPPKYKNSRQELLGISSDMNSLASAIPKENEVEMLLNYHSNMQDKIADEMLALTKSLKEQTLLAGNIIRKDTETVQKSAVLAESNFSKLKIESEKLKDHSKRAWKCWMWLMIFVVMAVFINMVLFMKVMKKRTT